MPLLFSSFFTSGSYGAPGGGGDNNAIVHATTSLPTGVTGTRDITTVDLKGQTPKMAILVCSRATVSQSPSGSAGQFSIGVTDGTVQYCQVSQDRGDGTPDFRQYVRSASIIEISNAASTPDGVAAFDSFIRNGIRINITNAFERACVVGVIFFCGDNFHGEVVLAQSGAGATLDVPSSFAAEAALFIAPGSSTIPAFISGDIETGLGFCVRSGLDQAVARTSTVGGEVSTLRDSYVVAREISPSLSAAVSSWDDSGLTLTKTGGSWDTLWWVAVFMSFEGLADYESGIWSVPTATGAYSKTGLSSQPSAVFFGHSWDGVNTDDASSGFGMSFCDPNGAFSCGMRGDSGAADADSYVSSANLFQTDSDGVTEFLADIGFEADGWSGEVTTAPAARDWWFLSVSLPAFNPTTNILQLDGDNLQLDAENLFLFG